MLAPAPIRPSVAGVDTALFVIVNLYNVLLIAIFLSRPAGLIRLERAFGLAIIALILPVCLAILANAAGRREWWTIALPALLVGFWIVELLLDYVLQIDFRHSRLLGPYLLFYYLSLWGMIGYMFTVSKAFGAVTLATYFVGLLATWYSYAQVGHGATR